MILFNYSVCNWTSNVLTENTHCCSFILFLPPHFLPILFSSSPSFVTISSSFLPPLFSSHPSSYRSPLPLHLLLLTHPQLLLHLCHLSSEAELLLMERRSGLRLMELQWHLVVKCQNCNRTGDKDRLRKVVCWRSGNRIITSTTTPLMTFTVLTHQVNTALDLKSFVFLSSLHLCLQTSSGCLLKDKNEIKAKAASWIDSLCQNQDTLLIPSGEIGCHTVSPSRIEMSQCGGI